MKIKNTKYISVKTVSDVYEPGLHMTIDLNRAKNLTFHKCKDGSLEVRAPGLRNGSVKIHETEEELRSQVKRLRIFKDL